MSIHPNFYFSAVPVICVDQSRNSVPKLMLMAGVPSVGSEERDQELITFLQLILISDRTKTASGHVVFEFHIKGWRKRGERCILISQREIFGTVYHD
jgi:hypothetical protein